MSTEDGTRCRERAMQGDAEAQFELGTLCLTGGGGVTKNEASAIGWFRKAAEQGLAPAQVQPATRPHAHIADSLPTDCPIPSLHPHTAARPTVAYAVQPLLRAR